MIPIVGVSLEEALLGFGGDDVELHDKEVTLTTSDVTGSQTAIFEYDPQNEPVSGDPPGPWDGYSLFTIDLSGVKDDIEDLQQRIADAETCRQQVIAALQRYDPDYDPAEGECPSDKVDEVVDKVGELEDELEQCHDCKDEVIAAIQQYIPDYDPAPTDCPADEIDDVYQKGRDDEEEENPPGYTFPEGTDPTVVEPFLKGDPLRDETLGGISPYARAYVATTGDWLFWCGYIDSNGEPVYLTGYATGLNAETYPEYKPKVIYAKMLDPTTGTMEYQAELMTAGSGSWFTWTTTATAPEMIGYGDPSHTYRAKNVNN